MWDARVGACSLERSRFMRQLSTIVDWCRCARARRQLLSFFLLAIRTWFATLLLDNRLSKLGVSSCKVEVVSWRRESRTDMYSNIKQFPVLHISKKGNSPNSISAWYITRACRWRNSWSWLLDDNWSPAHNLSHVFVCLALVSWTQAQLSTEIHFPTDIVSAACVRFSGWCTSVSLDSLDQLVVVGRMQTRCLLCSYSCGNYEWSVCVSSDCWHICASNRSINLHWFVECCSSCWWSSLIYFMLTR